MTAFPTAAGGTYVVADNDQWAAARQLARRGDRIVVLVWSWPLGDRGLRYTVTGEGEGLTGPEAVSRQGNGAWSPTEPS